MDLHIIIGRRRWNFEQMSGAWPKVYSGKHFDPLNMAR